MAERARRTSATQAEAEAAVDLLRGFHRGTLRVGLNGKSLVSMNADSRQVRVDVAAWPPESGISWMRSAGSITEALRSVSVLPKLAKALSDLEWTVHVDAEGNEVAMFGHDSPALTGHMWVSPNPSALADQARRMARRWLDSKGSSESR
jgi:hypothetical protein